MASTGTILVVDDDDDTASLLAEALCRRGYAAGAVCSAEACLERLSGHGADVVVTDIKMPGLSGIELCHELRARHPDVLPLVLTGHKSFDLAIAAIRGGAYDFIMKPVALDALDVALSRALGHLQLRRELADLRAALVATEAIAGNGRARGEIDELRRRATPEITGGAPVELIKLGDMIRRHVRGVLGAVGGNKSLAARVLGIDRRSLYRHLAKQAAPGDDQPAAVGLAARAIT